MSRRITPSTSVDNLRQEAKRWLKALRAGDPAALSRFARAGVGLPRAPGLRDIQHGLAREFGFPGWIDLVRAVGTERDRDSARQPALQQLLAAALAGKLDAVRATLDAHPDLVSLRGILPGHSGLRSALHFAVGGGHVEVVRLLLERGADPNVRDAGDNALALHFAAEQGRLPIIQLLIEHGSDPIGDGTVHGLEVIGWATVFGKADPGVVSYLLAHGARHTVPSAVATGNVTALRQLVGDDRRGLEAAMDDSNRRRHPLHLAVVKRQSEALVTLIELGADLEARDSAGLTALDQAAIDGQSAMVQRLLDRGARVGLPAALALGRTGDIAAALRDEPRVLEPGQRHGALIIRAAERAPAETIETLIRHGADVNVHDSESMAVDGTTGYTALHAAAFHGNIDAARVLLRHGASVTIRDSTYLGTPLGWAAHAGHERVVELLRDAPIDLIDAVEHNRLDRIRELVTSDPDLVRRPIGELFSGTPRFLEWLRPEWTPMELAVAREQHEVVALLQQLTPGDDAVPAALVARFLDNACPDHHVRGGSDHVRARSTAMRLLEQHPSLATASFVTQVVCGDLDAVRHELQRDPGLASTRDGVPDAVRAGSGNAGDLVRRDWGAKGWTALLYRSFTRLATAKSNDNALAIITALLDAGADPNASFMAGDSRYTPLVGVIGEGEEGRPPHPHRDALVALLLERGADPFDGQVLYNIHFRDDILWYLKLIHQHTVAAGNAAIWDNPAWPMLDIWGHGNGARWILELAIRFDNQELAAWCLEHGADPEAPPATSPHFLQGSLYQEAVRHGASAIARMLQRHGASVVPVRLSPAEQLTAAAFTMGRDAVEATIAQYPDVVNSPEPLFEAARRNRLDVISLLLDCGVSVNVTDKNQEGALHQAVYHGAINAAQLLLERGADANAVGTVHNNTPLGAAVYARRRELIDLIAPYSRDLWELVYAGKVDRVRELVSSDPSVARAVGGGHTLLMWLAPDDEASAIETAKILLGAGADPAPRNQGGMTAAELAERNGMLELAKLLRNADVTRSPVGAAGGESQDTRRFMARDWDSVIDAIASHRLPAVHANGQMTDDVLSRLAKLSCVTALHLGGSKQLTDAGVSAIAAMPQLRTLDISGTQVTDAGMAVLRHLPQLETLRLGSTRVTDAGASHLAWCATLQRLDMMWTDSGDGTIGALAGLPALRHFVSGNAVTDDGLAALHRIPTYRTWQDGDVSLGLTSPEAEPNMLTLRGTFTDDGMRALIGLEGLFGLWIESPALTAHGLEPLIELPHLGKLSFDAHDDAMPIIARMPTLRFISIQDTDATDDGWTALATSRTIEGIWGRRCHGLRDRGFRALSTMPVLRQLAVSCKNVTDDAVSLLPQFPALRELIPMDIPDEGYRPIGKCDGLEVLTLMYCRDTTDRATELITPLGKLRKYFASYTQITDRTPELLATMPSLEEVEFAACAGVTQAGLAALAALPSLRRLKYSG